MSRGGRTGVRTFVRPGIRAHAMKFNVDAQGRRRLRLALDTLEAHEESVDLALRELRLTGTVSVREVMGEALRLLCFGPAGEFR